MRKWSSTLGRDGRRALCAIPVTLALHGVLGLLATVVLLLPGCGREDEVRLVAELACPVYDDSTSRMPRLLYEDGSRTLNDRCMVRPARLNPKIRAIYVNGRPVGFC